MKPYIEVGATAAGEVIYRFRCEACEPHRVGAWLKEIGTVERNMSLHQRACHPVQAVA